MATVDEQLAWMALARAARESAWWRRPIETFGSAVQLFAAADSDLRAAGLTERAVSTLRATPWAELEHARAWCTRLRIAIAHRGCEAYPTLLSQISDPPAVIYFRGATPSRIDPAVAIVGSRRATRYGRRVAYEVARELAAAGAVIVSGLAFGIDTSAHQGGLAGGRSAAVLACGLDRPYPRANRGLFETLAASAGVLSEYPPGTRALPYRFPARNRLVTGLARAVVIVEAAERSGSLVSARLGVDQGREVFAVPGNIDSPVSRGTNALLRDGCAPLLDAADVIAAIGLRASPPALVAEEEPTSLEPDERRIFAALDSEPVHADAVVAAVGLDGARVLELLTTLELAGLVERSAGGLFARARRGHFS